MKVPNRVIWSEGMFMSPQHLQQLDRYHEGYAGARVSALVPFDWGALAVEVDERALVAGQIRIQRFEGVLPDGMPVAFDGAHPEVPATRPIEGHFGPMQRVLEIFLAAPTEREGVPVMASTNVPAAGMRYYTAARPVVDAAGGATDVPVAFAQRHVAILFGDESRDDYDAIKVAEIVRNAAGALEVRKEYIPPIRRIGASTWLMNRLRSLLALMATNQRQLVENSRQRGDATVEFSAIDMTRFLRLSAINTFLPIVNHLIERSETSPEDAYLLLCQFCGQLATFTTDSDPTQLPKFFFTDLYTTFSGVVDEITRLLNKIDEKNYLVVPLESRPDGLHFGRLDDERLIRGANYVLSIRSNQPENVTGDQIPKLSKIASWSEIPAIVHSALPGVPVQLTHRPPVEIPPRAGTLYFVLNQGGQFWRTVSGERTIAIFLPPPWDPQNIKLELLAVPHKAGAANQT